jgi:hypothetical protein
MEYAWWMAESVSKRGEYGKMLSNANHSTRDADLAHYFPVAVCNGDVRGHCRARRVSELSPRKMKTANDQL